MRKAFQGMRGVQYDKDHFLTDLMLARDSTIFIDSDAETMNIMHTITHLAHSYGLKINADKTKVMATNGSQVTVYLDM